LPDKQAQAQGPTTGTSALPNSLFKNFFTMALSSQDVSRIAQLARLELASDEQAVLLSQLNGFFSIVEQMSAVDTRGVEPLYTPLSAVQQVALRLRDDNVTEVDQRSLNQRSAPAVEDGLFLVPKVME
jgi:aspartyl-tRNA(Asn)/glutamyl-tRNA(Gln) amidotransferase subunit C